MTTEQRYESAREIYKNIGVDTDLSLIHIYTVRASRRLTMCRFT